MKKPELENKARQLLISQRTAMLATYAAQSEMGDYPFGSMVRYVVAADGSPLLLLSRIAEHSKHLALNSHVSLLINGAEVKGEEQQTERITLLGELKCLTNELSQEKILKIAQPYFSAYPESEMYWRELDFDFYKLEVSKSRYILGFARAHWLKDNNWLLDTASKLENK